MPDAAPSTVYERSLAEIAKDWSGGATREKLLGLLQDGAAGYLVFVLETSAVRGITGLQTAAQCLQLLEKICLSEQAAPQGTIFAAKADGLKTALNALRRLPDSHMAEAAFPLVLQLLSLESERGAALAEGAMRLSLDWSAKSTRPPTQTVTALRKSSRQPPRSYHRHAARQGLALATASLCMPLLPRCGVGYARQAASVAACLD